MKVYEFGNKDNETIVMLHGGGLSWWNYREIADRLKEKYHVILPALDGHADSDAHFESIEKNASEIIEYINVHCQGKILALCGLSLGAQIAVEILAQKPEISQYAMIESVSLLPSKITNMLIGPTFSSSYFLIQKEWFSKLQFKSLHMKETWYEDYYRDTCKIEKGDMISFLKANTAYGLPEKLKDTETKIYIIVGAKEQTNMKKSARLLKQAVKNGELYEIEKLYHGEFSLNYPDQYVAFMMKLFGVI